MTIKEFLASQTANAGLYDFVRFDVKEEEVYVIANSTAAPEFTQGSPMQKFMAGLDEVFAALQVDEDGTLHMAIEFS